MTEELKRLEELKILFESSKGIYKAEAEEIINRLSLIKNSSLLSDRIMTPLDTAVRRLRKISRNKIENLTETDFKGLHELEREIKIEEEILELIENVISTFISHRNLSITLPILFEHLYKKITEDNELPFLVVSKEGEDLQTYTKLRNGKNKLVVGIVGIPLFSVSHLYEWIRAGHEFGHIIANKKLGVGIEYTKIIENYKMEILADFTALQIFGPVFLEVLAMRFTGARDVISETHPPHSWRLRLCYEQAKYFERRNFNRKFEDRGVKKFTDAIEKVISERYPEEVYKRTILGISYDDIKQEFTQIAEKKFEEVRDIESLKECYVKGYEFSDLLLKGKSIPKNFTPDQIVIGGYLASREKPREFKSYTQKVMDSLIQMKE